MSDQLIWDTHIGDNIIDHIAGCMQEYIHVVYSPSPKGSKKCYRHFSQKRLGTDHDDKISKKMFNF